MTDWRDSMVDRPETDGAVYAAGWTLSGLAVLGAIVAVWILGIYLPGSSSSIQDAARAPTIAQITNDRPASLPRPMSACRQSERSFSARGTASVTLWTRRSFLAYV